MLKGHKKFLLEGNSSQSLPWKQNGNTVVAAAMIPEVVNNWRNVLQINVWKKKSDIEPESPSITGKVCYHYTSWVTDIYMADMFNRNYGGKTSQIKWFFESKLTVVSAKCLLICFECLKESPCEIRKNVFYFTLKALFVLEIIKF